ncbi:hypothetical protein P7K49_014782 [Saguinus oedipus]|uniref:INTS6/SAGE1/DDX26B/CT45 C-terminal domain-containing protein n=1 Tax=Saguinus oedipus TaxID=9490 RepID=A0ABQ9V7C7_SAGOE|nr:hypothetical protein P7K49_014782 [Saguinus oedipus]
MGNLNDILDHQQTAELPDQEIPRWKQPLKAKKKRPGDAKAGIDQPANVGVISLAHTSPSILHLLEGGRDHVEDWDLVVEGNREAGHGGPSAFWPQFPMKSVGDDGDVGVSFECPKREIGEAGTPLQYMFSSHLDLDERLRKLYENLNCVYHTSNRHKKMAQDLAQELKKDTSSFQREIIFYEKMVQEGWMAAASTERVLQALWKEHDNRQKPTDSKAKF